jgi:sugar/nucleoside kinase (ribokinase family)
MQCKRFDLVVVGDFNIDLVLTGMERMPVLDREELARDMTITIGGSAANVACTAARLGLKVALIAQLGDDHFGRLLLEKAREAGVDTGGVIVTDKHKTGVSVSMVIEGQRGFASFCGSMAELRYEQVDLDLVAQGRHLHSGSFYLLRHLSPRLPELLAFAREQGLTTSLDTGDDPAQEYNGGLRKALAEADFLLPNELEVCHATGGAEVAQAARIALQWADNVVVKRGAKGSAWFNRHFTVEAPAFPVEVVDTTGSGDAWNAGLLTAIVAGKSPREAMVYANAVGALSVRKPGGGECVSGPEEVEAFLRSRA